MTARGSDPAEPDLQETAAEEQLQETIEQLGKELEVMRKLAEDRLNQLKYLQADFDNYRKKFDKEKEAIICLANENLIKDLLVIIDDFERALSSVENEKNREGLTMIYKKLLRVLGNYGLKSIDALGKKFDPNCHEVLCKEICNEENDLILEEYQKGYQLKSKVIRPSKVKIAEKGTGEIGDSYA